MISLTDQPIKYFYIWYMCKDRDKYVLVSPKEVKKRLEVENRYILQIWRDVFEKIEILK